jgi:hypothetical protein
MGLRAASSSSPKRFFVELFSTKRLARSVNFRVLWEATYVASAERLGPPDEISALKEARYSNDLGTGALVSSVRLGRVRNRWSSSVMLSLWSEVCAFLLF